MTKKDEAADKSGSVHSRRGLLSFFAGWTTLEGAKLTVEVMKGILFPGALAYVGLEVGRQKQANEALVARRIKSLDLIAPAADDILCFVTVVGHWAELTPTDVIDRKRKIDREMWTYLGIWPPDVMRLYRSFMKLVFVEYGGGGGHAALIYGDVPVLKGEMGSHFDNGWENNVFAQPPAGWTFDSITEVYKDWMETLRKALTGS